MMSTRERAFHLAKAVATFSFLGKFQADDLIRLVELELGHAEILDRFSPYGNGRAFARPLSPLLHIVSDNTPHAALQSMMRGLLLGAQNWIKLPQSGLPEVHQFYNSLPLSLQSLVEFSHHLPTKWQSNAQAIIAFGSDPTMADIRQWAGHRIFIPHGHKMSLGVVFSDPNFASVKGAARDISLFDQQGCLSMQVLYVGNVPGGARRYAQELAKEMQEFEKLHPRRKLDLDDAAAIRQVRETYRFRMAAGEDSLLLESPDSDAWTVIYTSGKGFSGSCLNRVAWVKPLLGDMAVELEEIRPWISTLGIWPFSEGHANAVKDWGASRICSIGNMQDPALFWHQDGKQTLASLVQWIDLDKDLS